MSDHPQDGLHLLPVQRIDATGHEYIILRPIGDVHIGSPTLDERYLDTMIEEIATTPNMYWLGLGDDIENNTKIQKHAGVYHQTEPPSRQRKRYVEKFKPIADKCVAKIGGNHDERSAEQVDFDVAYEIADALGIADKYADDGLYVRLEFGQRTMRNGGRREQSGGAPCRYTLLLSHGRSGSGLISGKSLALERMSQMGNADIYIGAHTHTQIIFMDEFYDPTWHDKKAPSKRVRMFVNTGAMTKFAAYTRKQRMRPQPVGTPYLYLETRRERFWGRPDYSTF